MQTSDETKMALLQQRVGYMEENINKIMTNHLPHLQVEMEAMNEKVDSKFEKMGTDLVSLKSAIKTWATAAALIISALELILHFSGKA